MTQYGKVKLLGKHMQKYRKLDGVYNKKQEIWNYSCF